jgi:hypothetical protein
MADDLKTWVVAAAQRFSEVWEFNDYWKRSNTFHALLSFVDAAEKRWPNDPALGDMQRLRDQMIAVNADYFGNTIGCGGVWADDYGWCGLSCMAAWDYLRAKGDSDATLYLTLAQDCWATMTAVGYDATSDAGPVPHGCGNVSPVRKRKEGGYGTRNTVTNTNLLVLSLRLAAATGKQVYKDMVNAQADWFAAWFADNYQSLDDGYYLRTVPGIVSPSPLSLIHERPLADTSYTSESDPTWERGWVWTGDQGLLLRGLAALILDGNEHQAVFTPIFHRVVFGVRSLLFGTTDKVLREAPFGSSFNAAYAPDYVGGRGVLMRYISDPLVVKVNGGLVDSDGVRATADAAWNGRDQNNNNQFRSLWNAGGDVAANAAFVKAWGTGNPKIGGWVLKESDVYGVLQANGLDVLTAAMRQ